MKETIVRRMHSKNVVSSVLVALPVMATLAMAEPGGPRGPGFRHDRPPEAMIERHLEELGLDAEQTERVRATFASSKEAREAHRKQMRESFRELRKLLDQESPDETAIMHQAEKIGELRTEGHKRMLRTLLAVRAELTPEQREKLKELKPSRRERFRHGGRRGETESGE